MHFRVLLCVCLCVCALFTPQSIKASYCREGHFEHTLNLAISGVSSSMHLYIFCFRYMYTFINISSHSFSNGTSVDINSLCNLLQELQDWGREHFLSVRIYCKSVVYISGVLLWNLFSTTYFCQVGGYYTGILIKVIRLLDRLCMWQLMWYIS